MELIHNGGLADAGVSGNKNELRLAPGCNAVEGSEQGVDFGFPPVQFLWNQQPVWRVMFAQREFVDAMLHFPFSKTAPKITLEASRCLIAFLSRLGEQLHDDCRNRARNTVHLLAWRCRQSCDMTVHQLHWICHGKWQSPGKHFVERDAQTVQIAARIDRAVHAPGLLGGHVGQRADQELQGLARLALARQADRKSTRLNSSHSSISYAVFCLKKKK